MLKAVCLHTFSKAFCIRPMFSVISLGRYTYIYVVLKGQEMSRLVIHISNIHVARSTMKLVTHESIPNEWFFSFLGREDPLPYVGIVGALVVPSCLPLTSHDVLLFPPSSCNPEENSLLEKCR